MNVSSCLKASAERIPSRQGRMIWGIQMIGAVVGLVALALLVAWKDRDLAMTPIPVQGIEIPLGWGLFILGVLLIARRLADLGRLSVIPFEDLNGRVAVTFRHSIFAHAYWLIISLVGFFVLAGSLGCIARSAGIPNVEKAIVIAGLALLTLGPVAKSLREW
jgi:hypothetical protein